MGQTTVNILIPRGFQALEGNVSNEMPRYITRFYDSLRSPKSSGFTNSGNVMMSH